MAIRTAGDDMVIVDAVDDVDAKTVCARFRKTMPMFRHAFPAREVARLLHNSYVAYLGSRDAETCRKQFEEMVQREERGKDVEPDSDAIPGHAKNVRRGPDEWDRDTVIRPCKRTMVFARDVAADATRRSELLRSATSESRSMSETRGRKGQLDAAVTEAYATAVFRSGSVYGHTPSNTISRSTFTRLELALQHYCSLRKLRYGVDALVVSSGEDIDCFPEAVRQKTRGLWPSHDYIVLLREVTDVKLVRDVELIVAQVLRAVENDLRGLTNTEVWNPIAFLNRADVLSYFREKVDPRIRAFSTPTEIHGDTASWSLPSPDAGDCRFQGTVFKTTDTLVMTRVQHDRMSRRDYPIDPNLPLYANKNEDGGSFKLKYDVTVELEPSNEHSATIKSSADILRVSVLGPDDWRRVYGLGQTANVSSSDMTAFVRLGEVTIPTLEFRLSDAIRQCFGWLVDGVGAETPLSFRALHLKLEGVKRHGLRLVWCCVATHEWLRLRQRRQTTSTSTSTCYRGDNESDVVIDSSAFPYQDLRVMLGMFLRFVSALRDVRDPSTTAQACVELDHIRPHLAHPFAFVAYHAEGVRYQTAHQVQDEGVEDTIRWTYGELARCIEDVIRSM